MRILILSLIFLGLANAASFEDKLVSLIEKQASGNESIKVKVVSKSDLKSSKDIKFVIIELTHNKQRIPVFVTKNADMVVGVSNIFFTNQGDDETLITKQLKELETHNENSQTIAAGELIKQLKPEQFITLKSKAKNAKTIFVIADPNCGYCKEEFRNIDKRLKTENINVVMVGILGEDSLKKAAWITNKIKSSDSEKVKLEALQEVFSNNFKAPQNIDINNVKETTNFLFKTGVIRGVPYIYEVK